MGGLVYCGAADPVNEELYTKGSALATVILHSRLGVTVHGH